MEIFAGLSVGLLILAALVVVIKMFSLWVRSRGLPELLLSLYLTGATVLGYPLNIAGSRVSAADMWPLHFAGSVAMGVGFGCLLLFTQRVFRPAAGWARAAVGLSVLLLAASSGAYLRELTGDSPKPASELIGITALTTGPIAFAYLWTSVEALSSYRQLRLRLKLGLTEIAVVNRVLLWGLMSSAAGLAVLISVAGMLAGSFLSAPIVLVLSCLGLVHACCLFLAFHPPAWYRAWLVGRAPVAAG